MEKLLELERFLSDVMNDFEQDDKSYITHLIAEVRSSLGHDWQLMNIQPDKNDHYEVWCGDGLPAQSHSLQVIRYKNGVWFTSYQPLYWRRIKPPHKTNTKEAVMKNKIQSWEFLDLKDGYEVVDNESEILFCCFDYDIRAPSKRIAELIVTAVNDRDHLINILNEAKSLISHYPDSDSIIMTRKIELLLTEMETNNVA